MKLTKQLTEAEQARLESCEERILAGMQTFLDVAEALVEIRDGRLYRDGHATFGDYCESVWSMSRQRAYQLIDAGKVAKTLPAECQLGLTSKTAEALKPVAPEDRADVLKAAGGDKATVKTVKAEIAKRKAEPEPTRSGIMEHVHARHADTTEEPPRIRTADEELREMAADLLPALDSATHDDLSRREYGDRIRQLVDEIRECPMTEAQRLDVLAALRESIELVKD